MKKTSMKPPTAFSTIEAWICQKLEALDEQLTYHNVAHTLDVTRQCERLAKEEGLEDEQKIYLLKVAALYHDTGFLKTYKNHEAAGCVIFESDAARFGFDKEEQAFVQRLIMATKLPQTPNDIYERIICDADLDYLGRPDFFTIGDGLRKEFLHYGVVTSDKEWEALQIKFLAAHYYHTESSKKLREPVKQQHLAQLH